MPLVQQTTSNVLCTEFNNDIGIGVWNATALFCRDALKAKRRLEFAIQLAQRLDVLIVVEAHGQDGCEQELLYRLRNTHSVEYFPGSTQAT